MTESLTATMRASNATSNPKLNWSIIIKTTQQYRIERSLRTKGATQVGTLSGCTVWSFGGSSQERFFVGSAGSFRVGKTRATSRPVPASVKAAYLQGTFSAEPESKSNVERGSFRTVAGGFAD